MRFMPIALHHNDDSYSPFGTLQPEQNRPPFCSSALAPFRSAFYRLVCPGGAYSSRVHLYLKTIIPFFLWYVNIILKKIRRTS